MKNSFALPAYSVTLFELDTDEMLLRAECPTHLQKGQEIRETLNFPSQYYFSENAVRKYKVFVYASIQSLAFDILCARALRI